MTIRVAVVDDHPVVRDGTAALLASRPELKVVGVAGSLAEAAALVASTAIDVLLLDVRLGTDSGLTLLGDPDRRDGSGSPAIIVLTSYDYPQYAQAALRLGAAGFVLKTAPIDELLETIAGGIGHKTERYGTDSDGGQVEDAPAIRRVRTRAVPRANPRGGPASRARSATRCRADRTAGAGATRRSSRRSRGARRSRRSSDRRRRAG